MKNTHPTDENDINDFLQQVDLIFHSSYLQNRQEQSVKINWEKDEGLKVTSTPMPDRESVEAFVMRMRPIIVHDERLHTGKILTYLIEHSENEKEKDAFIKLQTLIEQHKNKRLFSIKVNDKEYGMPDFVWLYLYGKYFHVDKEKQEIIQKFEAFLGPLTEISALNQLEGYAGWAMLIAGYIKKRRAKKEAQSKTEK